MIVVATDGSIRCFSLPGGSGGAFRVQDTRAKVGVQRDRGKTLKPQKILSDVIPEIPTPISIRNTAAFQVVSQGRFAVGVPQPHCGVFTIVDPCEYSSALSRLQHAEKKKKKEEEQAARREEGTGEEGKKRLEALRRVQRKRQASLDRKRRLFRAGFTSRYRRPRDKRPVPFEMLVGAREQAYFDCVLRSVRSTSARVCAVFGPQGMGPPKGKEEEAEEGAKEEQEGVQSQSSMVAYWVRGRSEARGAYAQGTFNLRSVGDGNIVTSWAGPWEPVESLLAVEQANSLRLYCSTPSCLRRYDIGQRTVESARYAPRRISSSCGLAVDATSLYGIFANKSLTQWDERTGDRPVTVSNLDAKCVSIICDADNRRILVGQSGTGKVAFYDQRRIRVPVSTFEIHSSSRAAPPSVLSLKPMPASSMMLSVTPSEVRVWDKKTGKVFAGALSRADQRQDVSLAGRFNDACCYDPDGAGTFLSQFEIERSNEVLAFLLEREDDFRRTVQISRFGKAPIQAWRSFLPV